MEEKNIQEFEATLSQLIEVGAGDRKTALRWLIESTDQAEYLLLPDNYVDFYFGLPWGYVKNIT